MQIRQYLLCKNGATIFGYKDQVNVEIKDAVSAASNFICAFHRPNYNTTMKILRAYRYQLKITPRQRRLLACFAGCKRFVYNKALALQKDRHASGQKNLGYAELCKELTTWRHTPETVFLSEAPTHPLQQGLKDLDRAYTNFFSGRAAFPRFKKKGRHESFRYPDAKQVKLDEENSRIFLPKLGYLRYRQSREIQGVVKQVTVSCAAGKWYISIQTEREVEQPIQIQQEEEIIGIDLGVVRFATLSNGEVYEPRNPYRNLERKLAKKQRSLARKQKGGANWRKQVRQISRIHKIIADRRRDFLHKTSTAISKNHAMVVMEDLNVKGMSASAAGTMAEPGRGVKAKSGLNKSILDQGWYEFGRQLGYKLGWKGGLLLAVPAKNTSRRCAECDYVSSENRKEQAKFRCVACGHTEHADLNAARNILTAGRAVLACGEKLLSISAKQEPTVSAALSA